MCVCVCVNETSSFPNSFFFNCCSSYYSCCYNLSIVLPLYMLYYLMVDREWDLLKIYLLRLHDFVYSWGKSRDEPKRNREIEKERKTTHVHNFWLPYIYLEFVCWFFFLLSFFGGWWKSSCNIHAKWLLQGNYYKKALKSSLFVILKINGTQCIEMNYQRKKNIGG